MPGRRTHTAVAGISGGATSFAMSRGQRNEDRVLETIGGVVAGAWSGSWADLLEPAYTPRHRGPAHALLPNAVVWAAYGRGVPTMQAWLRSQADRHWSASCQEPSILFATLHKLLYAVYRLLAGAAAAIPLGYLSHVVLDAATPMGVGMFGLPQAQSMAAWA